LGCGEDKKEEAKVTIKIGYLTDFTGPAATAMVPNLWAILDAWEYLEVNDPIPGVKLELLSYDTAMDASKAIPGYEWMKDRGVMTIFSFMPQNTDIIAPFLAGDKMTALSHTVSAITEATPWVFNSGLPVGPQYTSALQWVQENWPNYPTRPKVGLVGWNSSYEMGVAPAVEEYVLSLHPDKFEWLGAYLAPMGTTTWGMEVQALKDCDYVIPCHAGGSGWVTFLEQYRNAGYNAPCCAGEGMAVWTSSLLAKLGWEKLDGSINALTWSWWTDDNIYVDVGKEALARKHGGETELSLGYGYISQVNAQFFWYKMIKAAIVEVGAENVTSESLYNPFEKFSITMPDMPEMGYTTTSRVNQRYARIYEWKASVENIERIQDWTLAPTS